MVQVLGMSKKKHGDFIKGYHGIDISPIQSLGLPENGGYPDSRLIYDIYVWGR